MSYAKGANRERQLQARLEADGWSVMRSAGSHSPADLLAGRRGKRYAIQVKGTKAGPFSDFGPAEREELVAWALEFHAQPVLVWWPADRKPPRWILPDAWPQLKTSGKHSTTTASAAA